MTAHFVDLLDALRRRTLRMASLVEDILAEACDAVFDVDRGLAVRVQERDEDVDNEEVEVEREVIRLLALYQPVGSDLRLLCTVLKFNNDLERIADCAVNLAERSEHVQDREIIQGNDDVRQMGEITRRMLHNVIRAFVAQSQENARSVFTDEEAVDALYGEVIRRTVTEASSDPQRLPSYLDLLSVAKNLERIADHVTNIAEDIVFLCTGEIVRHKERAIQ